MPGDTVGVAFDGGLLRPWRLADASSLVTAWSDPDIARWNQVPPAPTMETAERWIAGWQDRYQRRLAVDLVIGAHDDDVLGEVGLSSFSDIPAGGRGAIVGYWLMPQARGKGLASRALDGLVTWARSELGLTVVAARCHPDNLASHGVASRAGFAYERDDGDGNQLWFSQPRGA